MLITSSIWQLVRIQSFIRCMTVWQERNRIYWLGLCICKEIVEVGRLNWLSIWLIIWRRGINSIRLNFWIWSIKTVFISSKQKSIIFMRMNSSRKVQITSNLWWFLIIWILWLEITTKLIESVCRIWLRRIIRNIWFWLSRTCRRIHEIITFLILRK